MLPVSEYDKRNREVLSKYAHKENDNLPWPPATLPRDVTTQDCATGVDDCVNKAFGIIGANPDDRELICKLVPFVHIIIFVVHFAFQG